MSIGPIGVVGLGIMGSAMSSCIIRRGGEVIGFDVVDERLEELVAGGGHAAASSADIAKTCSVVITSLASSNALSAALVGPDGLNCGRTGGLVIIETSTLSVAEKIEARGQAESFGAILLDCPLSGTGKQARSGDVVAYLSGDDASAMTLATDVLLLACRSVVDVGLFGNGTKMKFIANLLVAVHNAAAAEALVLAKRSGMNLDAVLQAVGDGAGGSRMLDVRGPMMVTGDFSIATMRVSTFQKDIALITAFAEEIGSATPLFSATADLYRSASEQGHDDEDTACIFSVIDRLSARN